MCRLPTKNIRYTLNRTALIVFARRRKHRSCAIGRWTPTRPTHHLPPPLPRSYSQARTLSVNAGNTWPAVLACTQYLARALPSLGGEKPGGEGAPDGSAAALRQIPTADPSHYPQYDPPLMAAQQRLRQRRRAGDAVGAAQVKDLISAAHLVFCVNAVCVCVFFFFEV